MKKMKLQNPQKKNLEFWNVQKNAQTMKDTTFAFVLPQ